MPQSSTLYTTGKAHARCALIEAAWADRSPANVRRQLQWRLGQRPTPLQALSWKAQGRRCTRDRHRLARGKPPNRGVVAIARDLRACMWTMAQPVPVTSRTPSRDWP
jgi:hypothetical protein